MADESIIPGIDYSDPATGIIMSSKEDVAPSKPSITKDPALGVSLAKRLNELYNHPAYKKLSPEKQEQYKEKAYDKWVKPYFEKHKDKLNAPPSKENWLKNKAQNQNPSFIKDYLGLTDKKEMSEQNTKRLEDVVRGGVNNVLGTTQGLLNLWTTYADTDKRSWTREAALNGQERLGLIIDANKTRMEDTIYNDIYSRHAGDVGSGIVDAVLFTESLAKVNKLRLAAKFPNILREGTAISGAVKKATQAFTEGVAAGTQEYIQSGGDTKKTAETGLGTAAVGAVLHTSSPLIKEVYTGFKDFAYEARNLFQGLVDAHPEVAEKVISQAITKLDKGEIVWSPSYRPAVSPNAPRLREINYDLTGKQKVSDSDIAKWKEIGDKAKMPFVHFNPYSKTAHFNIQVTPEGAQATFNVPIHEVTEENVRVAGNAAARNFSPNAIPLPESINQAVSAMQGVIQRFSLERFGKLPQSLGPKQKKVLMNEIMNLHREAATNRIIEPEVLKAAIKNKIEGGKKVSAKAKKVSEEVEKFVGKPIEDVTTERVLKGRRSNKSNPRSLGTNVRASKNATRDYWEITDPKDGSRIRGYLEDFKDENEWKQAAIANGAKLPKKLGTVGAAAANDLTKFSESLSSQNVRIISESEGINVQQKLNRLGHTFKLQEAMKQLPLEQLSKVRDADKFMKQIAEEMRINNNPAYHDPSNLFRILENPDGEVLGAAFARRGKGLMGMEDGSIQDFKSLYIERLATSPEILAGVKDIKNVGTRLMSHLAELAISEGRDITLQPTDSAIPFYEKLGLIHSNDAMRWSIPVMQSFLKNKALGIVLLGLGISTEFFKSLENMNYEVGKEKGGA